MLLNVKNSRIHVEHFMPWLSMSRTDHSLFVMVKFVFDVAWTTFRRSLPEVLFFGYTCQSAQHFVVRFLIVS